MQAAEKQQGGKLIGTGTYGCVFTPPLLCKKGEKQRKNAAVGKVTHRVDAQKEIRAANLLRKIPLANNYFILPYPESCLLNNKEKQKEEQLDNCEPFDKSSPTYIQWKNAVQIFQPYGGNRPFFTLMDTIDLHPSRFNFYNFMKHILQAGGTLLLAGICHYDLHPNNLLADENGVVRILDLGQAFVASEIQKETLEDRWKIMLFGDEGENQMPHPYIFNSEAPEITIANGVRNKLPLSVAISRTIHGKAVYRDCARILKMPLSQAYRETVEFFTKSLAAKEEDWTLMFQLYWPGFDAWPLGSILLQVIRMQMTWPFFANKEWQMRQVSTFAALRGMLHPNPMKRLDCIEALAIFDPGSSWIERFGQGWLDAKSKNRSNVEKLILKKNI